MKIKTLFYLLVLSTILSHATVYEDAEDKTTDGWSIYDDDPVGATITNVFDRTKRHGRRVIKLQGDKRKNGYMLGSPRWHDTKHKIISWRMKFNENFVVYVLVKTTFGQRYMTYTSKNGYHKKIREYIFNSLGGNPINHGWVLFERNLQKDISEFEPNNKLISIEAFLVRGSGLIDDIETKSVSMRIDAISHIYDIGGNVADWKVYDSNPDGATVTSVEATYYAYTGRPLGTTHHTKLEGDGRNNGYMLGSFYGKDKWNNKTDSIVTCRINFKEDFVIYVAVQTKFGHRFLTYVSKKGYHKQRGEYLIQSLKGDVVNNGWIYFYRDIEQDLHDFEPNNKLIALNGFLVRGSGLIDNVITYHKDQASLLLAKSDKYNHTEQYDRYYAELKSLKATNLVYLYSPYNPYGAIGFYVLNSNGTISDKSSYIPNISNRWNPMHNVEDLQPTYITTANIWEVDYNRDVPEDDGIPSDGSYLLFRERTSPHGHMVYWAWYDIRDLNDIKLVEHGTYEGY